MSKLGNTFDAVEDLVAATKIIGELRADMSIVKTMASLLAESKDINVLQNTLNKISDDISASLAKHKF
ncbi:hypothetical protein [Bacillus velezensis]|uniref:hypothetical protein n=1 Tax=Bacillus velezensis TaxID=492670 RepID=UPI00114095D0|nr:hypothetical protein [Bacillus velezensis]MCM3351845.1 hypothetical protein [Bacillus velezensis]